VAFALVVVVEVWMAGVVVPDVWWLSKTSRSLVVCVAAVDFGVGVVVAVEFVAVIGGPRARAVAAVAAALFRRAGEWSSMFGEAHHRAGPAPAASVR